MKRSVRLALVQLFAVVALLLQGTLLNAAARTESINPQPEAQSIKAKITGDESIDYRFEASAGQTLKVTLDTANGANYFNVLREGANEAFFIGNINGTSFEGALPESGAYLIRVYLMRSAARRDESTEFTLNFSLSANAANAATVQDFADGLSGGPDTWEISASATADDRILRSEPNAKARGIVTLSLGAKLKNLGCRLESGLRWCSVAEVSGTELKGWVIGTALAEAADPTAAPLPTKFDASAQLKCSAGAAPGLNLPPLDKFCDVRVIRRTDAVELWILKPGAPGEGRFLEYENATFSTDDVSNVTWLRSSDNWIVGIDGSEFYFFPEILLTGD